MFEHASIISGMRDIISTSVVSLAMKKYAGVKNTSKSLVIQTQPSNHSTLATPQITTTMIPKGPEYL